MRENILNFTDKVIKFFINPCYSWKQVFLLCLVLVLLLFNKLVILGINCYQLWISPLKGYNCAYSTLYDDEPSCSEYGKRVIGKYGLIKGCLVLKNRLGDCKKASVTIKNANCFVSSNIASGNTASVCDKGCDVFSESCDKGGEACLKHIERKTKDINDPVMACAKGCEACGEGFQIGIKASLNHFMKKIKEEVVKLAERILEKINSEIAKLKKFIEGLWNKLIKEIKDIFKPLNVLIEKLNRIIDKVFESEKSPVPPVPEHKPPVPEHKPPVPEHKLPVPEHKPKPDKPSPIKGWSSQTDYRWANTLVRIKIVQLASNAIGGSSGQSTSDASLGWLTDIADEDGQRMRNAISIYHRWRTGDAQYKNYTGAQIRRKMANAFAGSLYHVRHKEMLVNRIIQVYYLNKNLPQNDEETLQYLGIRKQCLEWAMSIADEAGGIAKNYQNCGSVRKENVRPGMGYYNLNQHAMIIVDVYYNNKGFPTKLKVAESNWANEWSNPSGQVPWKRTIGEREVDFGYTVVDYDK